MLIVTEYCEGRILWEWQGGEINIFKKTHMVIELRNCHLNTGQVLVVKWTMCVRFLNVQYPIYGLNTGPNTGQNGAPIKALPYLPPPHVGQMFKL